MRDRIDPQRFNDQSLDIATLTDAQDGSEMLFAGAHKTSLTHRIGIKI